MGDWKVVVPEATINEFIDPQFYFTPISTHWTIGGDGSGYSATRVSTDQLFGPYCAEIDVGTGSYVQLLQFIDVANYCVSGHVKRSNGQAPTSSHVLLYINNTLRAPDSIEHVGNNWYRVAAYYTGGAVANQGIRLIEDGMLVDAMQAELQTEPTTYCDGTQNGCIWSGAQHTSSSIRSGQSRAGGFVKDLKDDYYFGVAAAQGAGAAPRDVVLDEFATLPGGVLNNIKARARQMTLIGPIKDTSAALHDRRQALIALLRYDTYPKDAAGWQPVRIRYDGGSVPKTVSVHEVGGLDGSWDEETLNLKTHERAAIKFVGPDPAAYAYGEGAALLDLEDSVAADYVLRRHFQDGQWDDMSTPAGAGPVYAIAEDGGYIYFGGNFTAWESANEDYIVRWRKDDQSWHAMDKGFNNTVRSICISSGGVVCAFGEFSQDGNGTPMLRAAYWTGSAWAQLGNGFNGNAYCSAAGLDGTIYAGGIFTTSGATTLNYIASISDPSGSWAAMGSGPGLNNGVYALASSIDGRIYAGGSFTAENGGTPGDYNRMICWNPTLTTPAWEYVADVNNTVRAIAVSLDGKVYFGGDFTSADSETHNKIAVYYGGSVHAMGLGLSGGDVEAIAVGIDGAALIGGDFAYLGARSVPCPFAKWNGAEYIPTDLKISASAVISAIHASPYRRDPVVTRNYEILFGLTVTAGTSYLGGAVTAENSGNVPQYPKIVIARSGGSSAVLKTVRNERTGDELLFDNVALGDGEQITIDTRPDVKSVVSNTRGPRADFLLSSSNLGSFSLLPGDNTITAFAELAGSPAMTAYLLWKPAFDGLD